MQRNNLDVVEVLLTTLRDEIEESQFKRENKVNFGKPQNEGNQDLTQDNSRMSEIMESHQFSDSDQFEDSMRRREGGF